VVNLGIVDTASKCLGRVKYVFGASQINTDGSGIADCSAFTQWVFKQNGINIGRNTESQMSYGQKIQKNELTPGDLVFFADTYASGYKNGVSHVGIYVGNNEFIHCSSGAATVVKSKLNSAYYQSHYLCARRLDADDGDKLDINDENNNTNSNGDNINHNDNKHDINLKWYGDLLVLILIILVLIGALVFSIKAFNIKLGGI
jgi:Cell wall-associated hydrolases (invasion-associated proteins)